MNENLMTNRQLAQLTAKGLCEWCYKEEQKVRTNFEYLVNESDLPVSDQIVIRPFEKVAFTNADENSWYAPTKDSFMTLIGGERIRRTLGF